MKTPQDLKARVLAPEKTATERLLLLMEILRSPDGCSWDRKQSHQSLAPYLLEEAYEVLDAIQSGEAAGLKEELGDLLCQIVFHSQIAKESGEFSFEDVAATIIAKLVERHPHVFENSQNLPPEKVRDQWEQIKSKKRGAPSVLASVPTGMPALALAFRIGEKAGGLGFDWSSPAEVLGKVKEEIQELENEMAAARPASEKVTEEVGDLLFAVASLARKLGVDPEAALKGALTKFRERFATLEQVARSRHRTLESLTIVELEQIWQQVKAEKDTPRD